MKTPQELLRDTQRECVHEYKLDFKSSIYICAHCGMARRTDPVPVGCTPADARMLRKANHELAIENHKLREKLAQLTQPVQEPVAWIYQNANTDTEYLVWKRSEGGRNWRPLYTATPQRRPLTEEQIAEASAGVLGLPHELPADYTGPLWIEGQVRRLYEYATPPQREFVGLTLEEMDEIIDGNIKITDSRLRDGVYGAVLDTITTLMEKNT